MRGRESERVSASNACREETREGCLYLGTVQKLTLFVDSTPPPEDGGPAICCLCELKKKSVSREKMCTQHALKTSVLVKHLKIIMH